MSVSINIWLVIVAHIAFWLVVGIRMARSRTIQAERSSPADATSGGASSRWSLLAMCLVTVTMGGFYLLLGAALLKRDVAGPRLLPDTMALRIAGAGLALGAIALIGWSYAVLHSFRLLARIQPGHQLCTTGPYALLRHPVYLGVNLLYVGCFLLLPGLGFLVQTLLNMLAYDFRARLEEEVLEQAFGPAYHDYVERTYRLVPLVY